MNEWLHRVHFGDCVKSLNAMPECFVNTCVTSPPYYGLRNYGSGRWEGGDTRHKHTGKKRVANNPLPLLARTEYVVGTMCECGAIYVDEQIGLEPTPDAYVERLVGVFRAVRRVLRDDGTLWVVMGDAYASNGGTSVRHKGIKAKDMIGIPWMFAFAMRADGWYLRRDIIWNKPNPMPESIEDRPVTAHEYIFLLSKSSRYYYDHLAITEPAITAGITHQVVCNKPNRAIAMGIKPKGNERPDAPAYTNKAYRNKRSVWTVNVRHYKDAHFATFPEELIEPCILAGSPVGGVVLDNFIGSGTTAAVAARLQRRWVGCELMNSYDYLQRLRTGRVWLENEPRARVRL